MKPTYRYRHRTGLHQSKYDELKTVMPAYGAIPNNKLKPHLERLRKASNIYYDLHNYNLRNLHASFFGVFGIKYKPYMVKPTGNTFCRFKDELFDLVEKKMDQFIINAHREFEYHSGK